MHELWLADRNQAYKPQASRLTPQADFKAPGLESDSATVFDSGTIVDSGTTGNSGAVDDSGRIAERETIVDRKQELAAKQ